jgi:hypothetical protein
MDPMAMEVRRRSNAKRRKVILEAQAEMLPELSPSEQRRLVRFALETVMTRYADPWMKKDELIVIVRDQIERGMKRYDRS